MIANYKCGCTASGDNVSANCPMHPNYITKEEKEIQKLRARIAELEALLAENEQLKSKLNWPDGEEFDYTP